MKDAKDKLKVKYDAARALVVRHGWTVEGLVEGATCSALLDAPNHLTAAAWRGRGSDPNVLGARWWSPVGLRLNHNNLGVTILGAALAAAFEKGALPKLVGFTSIAINLVTRG